MIPADQHPSEPRTSIRMDARLDAVTRAKVDALAARFRRPRAAVLCAIMPWGLLRGPTAARDGGAAEGPVCHLALCVDAALHARVGQAATAAGMSTAAWLCAVVRQVTPTDFPAGWREAALEERAHDSSTYGRRFMLGLDAPTERKLQQLVQQYGMSKAQIIRQLIAHATPEEFPQSWQPRAAELTLPPMPQQTNPHRDSR
jgi:predicted transcriptional regulator